jgi:hypothetical protein
MAALFKNLCLGKWINPSFLFCLCNWFCNMNNYGCLWDHLLSLILQYEQSIMGPNGMVFYSTKRHFSFLKWLCQVALSSIHVKTFAWFILFVVLLKWYIYCGNLIAYAMFFGRFAKRHQISRYGWNLVLYQIQIFCAIVRLCNGCLILLHF